MRKILVYILLLLCLASCSSVNNSAPFWFVSSKSDGELTSFKIISYAKTEEEAKNEAYLSLLSELSLYLGVDISSSYYNQLVAFDKIESLGLFIEKTDYINETYYLTSFADTELLLLNQSQGKKVKIELEKKEKILFNNAVESYKNREDLTSLKYYLDLFDLAMINEQEELKQVCLERLEYILSKISFSRGKNVDDVKLLRTSTIVNTGVKHAEIEISYDIINQDGTIARMSEKINSNEDGLVDISLAYPKTLDSGVKVYSLSIVDTLSALCDKYPELIPVLNLAKTKTITVPYDKVKDTKVLVFIEMLDDEYVMNEEFNESIVSYLTSVGCVVDFHIVDKDSIIENLDKYEYYDYIIIGQVGLEYVDDLPLVSAYGESSLLDVKNKSVIKNNEEVRSTFLDKEKALDALALWARKTMNSFIVFI